MLSPAPYNVLKNALFKNLIISRDAKDLTSYNPFSIPLQDKQYIVIIRDIGLVIGALNTLSGNDTYALKLRILMSLQLLDKYQAFNTNMSNDLKWLVASFISSIAFTNEVFWKDLRDKSPELFSIRRFRLEVHGVEAAETKLKGEKKEFKVEHGKKKEFTDEDDYKKLSTEDRKYADSYDEKFKTMNPSEYYLQMTRDELMFIATWLRDLRENSLLIELWCVLATSFEFYHFALIPEFQRMCDDVDELNVMGQYIRPSDISYVQGRV